MVRHSGRWVPRTVTLAAATAGVAMMALTACGSAPPEAAAGSTHPTSIPASAAAAGSQTPAAANAVDIQNFDFGPAAVTVKVGTTITWTNRDSTAHTVTATDGSWGSPNLDAGQTYTYTFTTPGTYDYLCTIHPFMTGTVTVTP